MELVNEEGAIKVEAEKDLIIDDVDFQELFDLETAFKNAENQVNKLSGTLYRLEQDQKLLLEQEKVVAAQLEVKRKEIIKRYRINDNVRWQIEAQTRKVIYVKG